MSGNECEPKQEKQERPTLQQVCSQLTSLPYTDELFIGANMATVAISGTHITPDGSVEKSADLDLNTGTWLFIRVDVNTSMRGVFIANTEK